MVAGYLADMGKLHDFCDGRVLAIDFCYELLGLFHFCYSCRLVARRCHDCDITGEPYTKLTTRHLFVAYNSVVLDVYAMWRLLRVRAIAH